MKIHPPFLGFKPMDYPKGSVTQWFGENVELYRKAVPGLNGHNGMDFVAPWGTPLLAVEDCVVYDVKDDAGGYGKYVRVFVTDTINNEMREWTYGHLSFIKCKPGDVLKAGDCLGLMGNTGFVISDTTGNGFWEYNPYAGTHLHLGLRKYNLNREIQNYPGEYLGSVDYKDLLEIPVKKVKTYASDDPVVWQKILDFLTMLGNIGK